MLQNKDIKMAYLRLLQFYEKFGDSVQVKKYHQQFCQNIQKKNIMSSLIPSDIIFLLQLFLEYGTNDLQYGKIMLKKLFNEISEIKEKQELMDIVKIAVLLNYKNQEVLEKFIFDSIKNTKLDINEKSFLISALCELYGKAISLNLISYIWEMEAGELNNKRDVENLLEMLNVIYKANNVIIGKLNLIKLKELIESKLELFTMESLLQISNICNYSKLDFLFSHISNSKENLFKACSSQSLNKLLFHLEKRNVPWTFDFIFFLKENQKNYNITKTENSKTLRLISKLLTDLSKFKIDSYEEINIFFHFASNSHLMMRKHSVAKFLKIIKRTTKNLNTAIEKEIIKFSKEKASLLSNIFEFYALTLPLIEDQSNKLPKNLFLEENYWKKINIDFFPLEDLLCLSTSMFKFLRVAEMLKYEKVEDITDWIKQKQILPRLWFLIDLKTKNTNSSSDILLKFITQLGDISFSEYDINIPNQNEIYQLIKGKIRKFRGEEIIKTYKFFISANLNQELKIEMLKLMTPILTTLEFHQQSKMNFIENDHHQNLKKWKNFENILESQFSTDALNLLNTYLETFSVLDKDELIQLRKAYAIKGIAYLFLQKKNFSLIDLKKLCKILGDHNKNYPPILLKKMNQIDDFSTIYQKNFLSSKLDQFLDFLSCWPKCSINRNLFKEIHIISEKDKLYNYMKLVKEMSRKKICSNTIMSVFYHKIKKSQLFSLKKEALSIFLSASAYCGIFNISWSSLCQVLQNVYLDASKVEFQVAKDIVLVMIQNGFGEAHKNGFITSLIEDVILKCEKEMENLLEPKNKILVKQNLNRFIELSSYPSFPGKNMNYPICIGKKKFFNCCKTARKEVTNDKRGLMDEESSSNLILDADEENFDTFNTNFKELIYEHNSINNGVPELIHNDYYYDEILKNWAILLQFKKISPSHQYYEFVSLKDKITLLGKISDQYISKFYKIAIANVSLYNSINILIPESNTGWHFYMLIKNPKNKIGIFFLSEDDHGVDIDSNDIVPLGMHKIIKRQLEEIGKIKVLQFKESEDLSEIVQLFKEKIQEPLLQSNDSKSSKKKLKEFKFMKDSN